MSGCNDMDRSTSSSRPTDDGIAPRRCGARTVRPAIGVRALPPGATESHPGRERYTEPFCADKRRSSLSSTRSAGRKRRCGVDRRRSPVVVSIARCHWQRSPLRAGREIVIAGHGQTVGSGHRYGQEVTRVELRQRHVVDQHVSRFAIFPAMVTRFNGSPAGSRFARVAA